VLFLYLSRTAPTINLAVRNAFLQRRHFMTDLPGDDFEVEEVDVEECAKAGKRPPRAKRYRIRIDRDRFGVQQPIVTKLELLALAGKSSEKWRVYQKLRGGQLDEVKDGEKVDLRERGVERFTTVEHTQTDGEAAAQEAPPARRAFRMPEEDEDYVNSLGLRWETIQEGKVSWLLIHEYAIPEGFNASTATLAIRVEGYPPAKLDMAYFLPSLSKRSGTNIPNLSPHALDGNQYQQWSRHYAWREDEDSLVTHLLRVKAWLLDELNR
jgi:hypothetical protein